MNTITNHIPKNWKPYDKLAFMNWMRNKIKSNHYTQIK